MPAQALERQLLVQEQALERQPLVQEQALAQQPLDGDMDTKKERRPSDAGSSSRPAWCHSLDTRAAEAYTRENVLKGTDGWDPGL